MLRWSFLDYLGTRGQILLWCAAVWVLIGAGIAVGAAPGPDPALFHTMLPMPVRVGGWWVTSGLAVYAALRKRAVPLAVGALMVMPVQRLASYLWAWVMSVIPGPPPGVPDAWYNAIFYLLAIGLVLIAACVKEPTRDGRI
ncbi:hypothetical protein CRM73_00090 [Kocuria sp. CCUG 69068]|uniref:hypothetical protein n=1 Tax=Kocuria sp. CCUG 69068 TaxID=2043138 RepID=UPI001E46AF84|nr:hypothetical protein [Kocuria sp. CCUG 69068]